MRDRENRIIYVGKARILKNRLSSYFSGKQDVKIAGLVKVFKKNPKIWI
jgi:excinuclease ABC subunit C